MEKKIDELLSLTKDNNRMLKEIIKFINAYLSSMKGENNNDFAMNVIANLISTHMLGV